MKRLILTMLLLAGYTIQANNLVVHEWGTFTTFMGSDGVRQSGMHHEEEPLPSFVYGFHNPQEQEISTKRFGHCGKIHCEVLPVNPIDTGVTQKMETPVIYFYGDVGQKVRVDIDFPRGIISQYYPRARSYAPLYRDSFLLGPSHFTFDVELMPHNFLGSMEETSLDSVWNQSRKVDANTIAVAGEHEKFIFYRGVGDFDAKLEVQSDADSLTIINNSISSVNHVFLLTTDGSVGAIHALGGIDRIKTVALSEFDNKEPFDIYVTHAKSMIAKALVANGLFVDEALALVNTWEKSYFKAPGNRVLYLLPRIETDKIIPITLSPAPTELVRAMVGRVEIMTKAEEDITMALVSQDSSFEPKMVLGRFFEPKLRRPLSLALAKGDSQG